MAVSSNAIRAGRAFVELFADDRPFVRGLENASKTFQRWGANIGAIGRNLSIAGAAAAAPLLASVKIFKDVGGTLANMSQRTGISVESLSQLGFAAGQSGTDLETLEGAIRKMQVQLVDAKNGVKSARAEFTALGLSIEELAGLPPEEVFLRIADAIAKIQDPTRRAAAALGIFGRNGAELLPLMAAGRAGIEAFKKAFDDAGGTIKTETAVAADLFGNKLNLLGKVVEATAVSIGGALEPALSRIVGWLTRSAKAMHEFVEQNASAIAVFGGVVASITALGTALSGLGVALTLWGKLLSAVQIGLTAVMAVLGLITTPIGLVTAALTAGVAAWLAFTDAGNRAGASLLRVFGEVQATTQMTFQGIRDALAAGEFKLAAEVATAGMRLVWLQAMEVMTKAFYTFRDDVLRAWTELATKFQLKVNDVVSGATIILARIGTAIKSAAETAAAGLAAGLGLVKDPEAIATQMGENAQRELRALERRVVDENTDAKIELAKALREARQARAQGTAEEIKAAEAALESARRKLIEATQRAAAARAAIPPEEAQPPAVPPEVAGQMAEAAEKIKKVAEQDLKALVVGSQQAADHILRSIAPAAQVNDAKAQINATKQGNRFLKRINDVLARAPLLAASQI